MARKRYSHVYSLTFELTSYNQTAADVTAANIRASIAYRLAFLPDDELLEAIGSPEESNALPPGCCHAC